MSDIIALYSLSRYATCQGRNRTGDAGDVGPIWAPHVREHGGVGRDREIREHTDSRIAVPFPQEFR